jgi:hypothetical protein
MCFDGLACETLGQDSVRTNLSKFYINACLSGQIISFMSFCRILSTLCSLPIWPNVSPSGPMLPYLAICLPIWSFVCLSVQMSAYLEQCAAKAFYSCPAIISRRPESQKTPKEPQLNLEEESKIIQARSHVTLEKSSRNYKPSEE